MNEPHALVFYRNILINTQLTNIMNTNICVLRFLHAHTRTRANNIAQKCRVIKYTLEFHEGRMGLMHNVC